MPQAQTKLKVGRTPKQISFTGVNGWGGRRRGAGRPNHRGEVAHARRAPVNGRTPLHLTLKLRETSVSLRRRDLLESFQVSAQAAQKFGLRVLHFSLLKDHLHLLVEVKSNEALARGMRSLGARLGKAIRKIQGGRGSVFKGRYHLRVITHPAQMRNCLGYVLQNFSKHRGLLKHIDGFSSAQHFTGWRILFGDRAGPILAQVSRPLPRPAYLCAPRSWLAREGWRRASQREAATAQLL